MIRIEGRAVNPDQVVFVDDADPSDQKNGYRTEVTGSSGKRLFKASKEEVVRALDGVGTGFSRREAPTVP